MEYISTRGAGGSVSASAAIVKGLATDGGLFVPNSIPMLTEQDFQDLTQMTYNQRAVFVLSRFLSDFANDELISCVNSAYNRESFETDTIAPLYKLSDSEYILELWHGPTCAFKDMALQLLPHLLTTSMKKQGSDKEVVILVATSGDTGKAALEGFCDVEDTRIIVFYPVSGVSNIQKLQMITQSGGNVGVSAIEGNFDDAQNGVKAIFEDKEYQEALEKRGFQLSSANSINWGRLVPQIVYYISAYCDLLKNEEIRPDEPVNFVVPTGNFGNILAAYYAMRMGVPVNKLICASNSNNVLTEFIRTGTYNKNRTFHTTCSPSMDILISSNLERLLYHVSGGDTEKVADWMQSLKTEGMYTVTDDMKEYIDNLFYGAYCDDKHTLETIRQIYEKYAYVPDTHTAVAINVYQQYKADTGDTTKTVIASTASPFKFNRSVLSALSQEEITEEDEFVLLEMLAKKQADLKIPRSLSELRAKEQRFTGVCDKTAMKGVIDGFLENKA